MDEKITQSSDNQWVEHSHEEWIELVSKELKSKDLESKRIHIDNEVIYDPFKEKIRIENGQEISDVAPLSIGLQLDIRDNKVANQILLRLLQNDLRVVQIDGDQVNDWNVLLNGIIPEIITMILTFRSIDSFNRFDQYRKSKDTKGKWNIVTDNKSKHESFLIDYSSYQYLRPSELIKCIHNDVALTTAKDIFIKIPLKENLLEVIPFVRALRISIEKAFPTKEVKIGGYRELKSNKAVTDDNQRVIEATTIAMYCAISGVDTLFFDPIISDEAINDNRILLNIQNILSLESQMHSAKDSLSGSYIIDDLTEQYLAIV